ncbi:head morphogenesis [Staphylococcus phage MVC_VPHSA2]|nr:head morphogenesis [Staphylococcus phage MVC_VPHSA2]
MDEIELAFLSDSQRLNKKRHQLLMKSVKKMLPELIKASQEGDSHTVDVLVQSIRIPSHKEYRKLITKLIKTAAHTGILRAHEELKRLNELYNFMDDEVFEDITLIAETTNTVRYPVQAIQWLENYALDITIITEATVRDRIVGVVTKGLKEGFTIKEMTQAIRETSETWLSQQHAKTIARTETSKMYNAGRLARYTSPENRGFVEALQYSAIIDRRTTTLCKHLDGKIVNIENQVTIASYSPPNHFQCRSVWLPVTRFEDWEDNFVPDEKPQKGFDSKNNIMEYLLRQASVE